MIGKCPNIRNNKTSNGYCKTAGCINPRYSQYLITGVEDGWIKVDKKTWDEFQEAAAQERYEQEMNDYMQQQMMEEEPYLF